MKPLNDTQVFYGRYLKKLSNKTQESMGEMTKVVSFYSSTQPSTDLSNICPGCLGGFVCSTNRTSLQRQWPRGTKVSRPGNDCPNPCKEGGYRQWYILRQYRLEWQCHITGVVGIRRVVSSSMDQYS